MKVNFEFNNRHSETKQNFCNIFATFKKLTGGKGCLYLFHNIGEIKPFWCVAHVIMACAWLVKPLNKREPKRHFFVQKINYGKIKF
jgi:hypothetical protein